MTPENESFGTFDGNGPLGLLMMEENQNTRRKTLGVRLKSTETKPQVIRGQVFFFLYFNDIN